MYCHRILLSFFDMNMCQSAKKNVFDADRWILLNHCNFVTLIIFYKMASRPTKRKTVTEADIEEFIENLDDGKYYPDNEFFDNDDNDEDSFCTSSDADENNIDDIRFVRNEVPKKLKFETLSKTLNEQTYDPAVPQERKIYKANVRKDKVLTWTTDKPNVSRKWIESNIICNKPGPSRYAKDIKKPLDSWLLLMTDDFLLEFITNTNKNIETFVNEHVGFDENDRIPFTKPTDIHEIWALIGLFYQRGALN